MFYVKDCNLVRSLPYQVVILVYASSYLVREEYVFRSVHNPVVKLLLCCFLVYSIAVIVYLLVSETIDWIYLGLIASLAAFVFTITNLEYVLKHKKNKNL